MSTQRRIPSPISLLIAAVLAIGLLPAPVANAAGDDVTFVGSGWGHGVGMSQYGAYGMALNGYFASQILNHYYSDTTVEDFSTTSAALFLSSEPSPLWVGLMQNQTSIQFTVSGGSASLCQGWGAESDCSLTANGGQTWRYHTTSNGLCRFERVSPNNPLAGEPRACDGSIRRNAGASITVGGYTYSWGVLRLREVPLSSPTRFHVSLQTAIEPYIKGIHEVFASWPSQALRAQAIASRSYVLANASARGPQGSFTSSVRRSCWCHLYDDTRSQVFKGDYMYGFPNWQNAVSSTAEKVVAYGSTLVSAFYSSSSGGKTENVEDVWGGTPRPWLVSVDDHWAHIDAVANPRSHWALSFASDTVAAKVGLDELTSVNTSHRSSGGVDEVTFLGKKSGMTATVVRSGDWVRSAFGLYSQYFDADWDAPSPINSAYDITWDNHTPIGWIDGVTDTGNGSLRARGWTLDFDTKLPLIVHVYVDGKFAKGLWADDKRPDVAKAHSNGDRHGFDVKIGTSDGAHTVCVYALNAPTKKGNPRIGCKTVNVTSSDDGGSPPPEPSGSQPFGWIDNVSVSNGNLSTRGWAIDKDAADEPVPIHIYVDGSFFQGGPADEYRPDVNKVHDLGTHHGFQFTKSISGGSHRVCVYAINLPDKSNNPLLGCKTVSG